MCSEIHVNGSTPASRSGRAGPGRAGSGRPLICEKNPVFNEDSLRASRSLVTIQGDRRWTIHVIRNSELGRSVRSRLVSQDSDVTGGVIFEAVVIVLAQPAAVL